MTSHQSNNARDAKHPQPKQAVVIDDSLFPMARARMTARDILDQAGAASDFALQRDYNTPADHVFADDEVVDLREGNVFKKVPKCAGAPCRDPEAKPKLAFIADDVWEVTIIARQTGHSLKRLLGLPDDADLYRDYESPQDQPVADSERVLFEGGPVFTVKGLSLTIKVNNKPVKMVKRWATGLEIKTAAIAQGVNIQETFVLYPLDTEGNLGSAIPDNRRVKLNDCDEFRCVAADDNS